MLLRPDRLVVVAGTGTSVGKTWVTASLATHLRSRGRVVAARKPVQSYSPGEGPTDAEVLAAATAERARDVCPAHRWYEAGLAPPMAADALGRPPFTIADLVAELSWPRDTDVGLVETAGGLRSPLAADGDSLDLVHVLAPDVVLLVADAGLGTINAVRLSLAALPRRPAVVVLNRFDAGCDLHRRNRDWLTRHDGVDVVTEVEELAHRLLVSCA